MSFKDYAKALNLAFKMTDDHLAMLIAEGVNTPTQIAEKLGISSALAAMRIGQYVRHGLMKRVNKGRTANVEIDPIAREFYADILLGAKWTTENAVWLSRSARFKVFTVLFQKGVPLNQGEISDATGLEHAGQVSTIVREMAARGIVLRTGVHPYPSTLSEPYIQLYRRYLSLDPGF